MISDCQIVDLRLIKLIKIFVEIVYPVIHNNYPKVQAEFLGP